jgi:hypothetical protein
VGLSSGSFHVSFVISYYDVLVGSRRKPLKCGNCSANGENPMLCCFSVGQAADKGSVVGHSVSSSYRALGGQPAYNDLDIAVAKSVVMSM